MQIHMCKVSKSLYSSGHPCEEDLIVRLRQEFPCKMRLTGASWHPIMSLGRRFCTASQRCLPITLVQANIVQPKPLPYHELLRALTITDRNDERLCAVCFLVRDALLAYLDDLIYSAGTDPAVRKQIRQGRGFCNRHAHLFKEGQGVGLGVALIHWDVVETVAESLSRVQQTIQPRGLQVLWNRIMGRARRRRAAAELLVALRPQHGCLACQHQLRVEQVYLHALLDNLDDEALIAALRSSPGLCLPHFEQALGWVSDDATLATLLGLQLHSLGRLSGELQELARKFDHRFQHEVIGAEGDSWLRSIDQVTGRRGIR